MGYPVKQSSAAQPLVFFMTDSSDHITGKTGLSPTVRLSKNGGAFSGSAPAGAVSEIGNGFYQVAANATDNNTLGPLALHATASGADPTDDIFMVVAYDPQVAANLGLTDVTAIKAKTDNLPAAPAAVGNIPSPSQIADQVWDEVLSGHATAGSAGAGLSAAGSAGDPLSNPVPGSYASGTAGHVLGLIGTARVIALATPIIDANGVFSIVRGDGYYAADDRSISFTFGASPDLTGATVAMKIQSADSVESVEGDVTGEGTSSQVVSFELSESVTSSLSQRSHDYDIEATLASLHVVTLGKGMVNVTAQVE